MSDIDNERFVRVLSRCVELGNDPAQPGIIGIVYKQTAEAPITTFLEAEKAVVSAETAFSTENREALAALAEMDAPYRVARSAVMAILPDTVIPDTLKARKTDTDKLHALELLLDIIDDHVGTPWADALLQGDFGQRAPKTVKELGEAVAASNGLGHAVTARSAAHGPAYQSYLRFKRVVRDVKGPASKEYRRIHLRASPGAAAKDDAAKDEAQDGSPANTTQQGTSPANSASPAPPATPPAAPAAPSSETAGPETNKPV